MVTRVWKEGALVAALLDPDAAGGAVGCSVDGLAGAAG